MLELAGIIILGILAQWLAWRLKIPAILPLILFGLFVGPVWSYFSDSGEKLIASEDIFQGTYLFDFVALAVGIILFEGGLSLKINEVKTVASVVRNMLIFGSLVTLLGTTAAVYYIMDIDLRIALLFGALVIVTGPTVIKPILNNVRPTPNISTVLKWEGVLIDPIGAMVAILVYEFIISGGGSFTVFALTTFSLIVLAGFFVGIAMAFTIRFLLARNLIPHYLRNVIVLAMVLLAFAGSDFLHAESGLLAVTVMGMILSNTKVKHMEHIISFKEDITVILISVLFIVLSARINIIDFEMLGLNSLIVFVILILIIRPIGVFLSARKSDLSLREKLFISWISPRGIVSAGVASIFALHLTSDPELMISDEIRADAGLLLPLTFLVIVGTVVLQGATAKPIAKWLGVTQKVPNGYLIIGANDFAQLVGEYLHRKKIPVLFSDTSKINIEKASRKGLNVYRGNLLLENHNESGELSRYGKMMALTQSTEVNVLACDIFGKHFGEESVYRLMSKFEFEDENDNLDGNILFEGRGDYLELSGIVRNDSIFKEKEFASQDLYDSFVSNNQIVPLFLEYAIGQYVPISNDISLGEKSFKLVYLEK